MYISYIYIYHIYIYIYIYIYIQLILLFILLYIYIYYNYLFFSCVTSLNIAFKTCTADPYSNNAFAIFASPEEICFSGASVK